MIYKLCIREAHYRMGMFRIEHFTDLKLLEQRRVELTNERTKCWVA